MNIAALMILGSLYIVMCHEEKKDKMKEEEQND